MTDPTPAAGGLSETEIEQHVCCVKPGRCKGEDHFHQRSVERIIAARTEAADRELARVTAAVEALADEWCTEGPSLVAHAHGARDVHEGSTLEKCARDLRAALSSADTDALDRERAKAAAEALREAADEWDRRDEEHLHRLSAMALERYQAGGPSMPAIWLRDRAAAVSPEGGDA